MVSSSAEPFSLVTGVKEIYFGKNDKNEPYLLRHKSDQDQSDVCHGIKRAKEMLDKDSVFFWRLFQDIFKTSTVNFTGIELFIFVFNNLPRFAGSSKCQQLRERESDLQKRFQLCPLQVTN